MNLTDGVYYANKDVDTELTVEDTSGTMTRADLQLAIEDLQKEVQNLKEENTKLKDKDKTQDTAISTNKTNIESLTNTVDTLSTTVSNINKNMLAKTYPVGSIYISTSSTNPANIFGGTWQAYATGRTLVGINTSDTNFNSVGKTGGASTVTLTAANLAAHTHFIPALSGSAGSAGSHTHNVYNVNASSGEPWYPENQGTGHQTFGIGAQFVRDYGQSYRTPWGLLGMQKAGAHTHSVTTTASISGSGGAHTHTITTTANKTGSVGSGTAVNNLQPYITVYMWKRTA